MREVRERDVSQRVEEDRRDDQQDSTDDRRDEAPILERTIMVRIASHYVCLTPEQFAELCVTS